MKTIAIIIISLMLSGCIGPMGSGPIAAITGAMQEWKATDDND